MMSKLTQLRDEALRLHTVYQENKHHSDPEVRLKVHVDLDRFLMANRETAILLMTEGLDRELAALLLECKAKDTYKPRLLDRILKLRKQHTIQS